MSIIGLDLGEAFVLAHQIKYIKFGDNYYTVFFGANDQVTARGGTKAAERIKEFMDFHTFYPPDLSSDA